MIKAMHLYIGLLISVTVFLSAGTAVVLSTKPVVSFFQEYTNTNLSPASSITKNNTVITLPSMLDAIVKDYPTVERIKKNQQGNLVFDFIRNEQFETRLLNTQNFSYQTIKKLPSRYQAVYSWSKRVHRALFLGTTGRIIMALSTGLLILMIVSGVVLSAHRLGVGIHPRSWKNYFKFETSTRLSIKLHTALAKLMLPLLLVLPLSGLYLSLGSFEWVSTQWSNEQGFQPIPMVETIAISTLQESTHLSLSEFESIKNISLDNFKQLLFPFPGDPQDGFTLTTRTGEYFIHPVTGLVDAFSATPSANQFYSLIMFLHTATGSVWYALLLAISSVAMMIISFTGGVFGVKKLCAELSLTENKHQLAISQAPIEQASVIILVGSESGSTAGFARTLHRQLTQQGLQVVTLPLNEIQQLTLARGLEQVFCLTSTFAEGTHPQSASQVLEAIQKLSAHTFSKVPHLSLLGFGDKNYRNYCGFAKTLHRAISTHLAWPTLLSPYFIDQKNSPDFYQWGNLVGAALKLPQLRLEHFDKSSKKIKLAVQSVSAFGKSVNRPIKIIRFKLPLLTQRFSAGDLIGIWAPHTQVPRYYSIANASKDGYLEIAVSLKKEGLCSTYLHTLDSRAEVICCIVKNSAFKVKQDKSNLILIGIGTGVAPLMGFARETAHYKKVTMFMGHNSENSDYLYGNEINKNLAKPMASVTSFPAFSKDKVGCHIQDRLRQQATLIREEIAGGAQIMLCGSRLMSDSIKHLLNDILAPQGINIEILSNQNRYLEDVY